MTEGAPKGGALRRADLFMGCEVDLDKLRPWITRRKLKFYRDPSDPHQIIVWNPRVIQFDDFDYLRFHRSGQAEGWGRLRTPSRGLLVASGHFVKTGATLDVGTAWFLNSWGKPIEKRRREIVETTTLPVVRDWVKQSTADLTLFAGDLNNIRWQGDLPGMRQIYRAGLDRMYVRGIPAGVHPKISHGPFTGVGNDRKHHSLNTRLPIPTKGKP